MLKRDPAIIWIWVSPKKGFKNPPINKSMQQAIDDCNDDKTLKPKILFCGRLILQLNFMNLLIVSLTTLQWKLTKFKFIIFDL